MISFTILDLRNFTNQLFRETTFDHFLVPEAEFATSFTVTIDGRQVASDLEADSSSDSTVRNRRGAEDQSEKEPNLEPEDFITWQRLRPLAFHIIKGRKLPQHFHIILKLNRKNTDRTLTYLGFPPEEGVGLYLNLRYEANKLLCITGCSRSSFTLDRTLEKEWDGYVRGFLRRHNLDFEES